MIEFVMEQKRVLMLLCAMFVFAFGLSAKSGGDTSIVRKFRIYYPINEVRLYEDYLGNRKALETIKEHFKKSPRIDSIVIYSYASPEGPYELNRYLARERGRRAKRYLLEHMPAERNFPDSLIIISPTAENWFGLYEMVSEKYPYSDKGEVLELLGRHDISNDRKKALLKTMNGRRPWQYIKSEILPELRYATWIAEWVHVPRTNLVSPVADIRPDVFVSSNYDIQNVDVVNTAKRVPADTSKIIFALKTNLLYDALSFLNFSVEAPLYKDKLSLLYYHQFPWWTWGQASNEFCVRYLSIGGEARYWFNPPQRFNGHFVGLYAESGKYDFEFQREICYQGEFWNAGLSYGYAMAVGRNLNFEFSLSVGYASIAYRGYTPSEDYEILWREPSKVGRWHYFGPTKAQISLVVPIKVKTRKGGGR